MSAAELAGTPVDPAVPSFGRLLDPVAATELVGVEEEAVYVRRLWYKPGRRLVAEYEVVGDEGDRTVVARSDRKLGPLPSVQWYPVDAALPALALAAEELAVRLGLPPEEPKRLGYKPFTRAALRIGAHVVKLYASRLKYEAAADALERVEGAVPSAPLEYASPGLRATVQAFVPGVAVDTLAAAPAAGGLLRRLHRIGREGLRPCPDRRLGESRRAAALVEAVAPELAARAHRLAARLEQYPPAYAALVTSHGDFEPGQLIGTPDGLKVVDLDELCVSAPADDLAWYAAHAARGRPDDETSVRAVLAALLRGYGGRPADLEGHVAASLLVRAATPFREQAPNWRERTEHLLAAAEVFA
jgi:aminoglycoside phosphotransferase (APT) family kinase protein